MPPPPPTFLMTLAVLSYKLLFHSDRELNLVSLIFCVACTWCVAQLYGVYWIKGLNPPDSHDSPAGPGSPQGPGSGTWDMDMYSQIVWEGVLRIARFLGEAIGQGIHFGCGFFSMGPEGRERCFEWGNWVQSSCAVSD